MHIIQLEALEDGVYNDHKSDNITAPPKGWAMIPENFPLPSTFPRLGSIEAENVTYLYEVEVEKEVTKTREVEILDENGEPKTITEEYKETEIVKEQRERVILTVISMTEGTLPEPEPITEPEPTADELLDILLEV